MKVITVKKLVWDEINEKHIKKHHITVEEVEEVCQGNYKQQPTYSNRYLIFGKMKSGRVITIVLSRHRSGIYYVVTARDMSRKERKRFIV